MRERRIGRVVDILKETDLDACILRGMDNIFYLTGFRGSEGSLIVTREDVLLLTDFRYITHAREVTRNVTIVEATSKMNTLFDTCSRYGIRKMGFDSIHTTYDMYLRWKEGLKDIDLVPLTNRIEGIRVLKDPVELEAIRKAIRIATAAFAETFETVQPGITEKAFAAGLDHAMRRNGADCPAFTTIVASGPRAALPHAEPTDREIREGETVIVDFGAQVEGYCSDETCTFTIGETSDRIREIFSVVKNAKDLGVRSIRAGMAARELDAIVRDYIEGKGYGDFFRHGVGHGVGVAVHEAPSISLQSDGTIEAGMVFTVEPGIYIPHLGGVRLEDMVLIEEDSTTLLTHIRKDMLNMRVSEVKSGGTSVLTR